MAECLFDALPFLFWKAVVIASTSHDPGQLQYVWVRIGWVIRFCHAARKSSWILRFHFVKRQNDLNSGTRLWPPMSCCVLIAASMSFLDSSTPLRSARNDEAPSVTLRVVAASMSFHFFPGFYHKWHRCDFTS